MDTRMKSRSKYVWTRWSLRLPPNVAERSEWSCAATFSKGGITPSAGLIATARKKISIGLHVMIRPRGGDFYYSDDEFEVMRRDVLMAKQLGADGVVFGLLDPDANVDIQRTRAAGRSRETAKDHLSSGVRYVRRPSPVAGAGGGNWR